MEQNDLGKTSTGINPTVAGLLCYLLGFVTGIIFLVLEKENRFVRFHAMQSIFVFGFLFILQMILSLHTFYRMDTHANRWHSCPYPLVNPHDEGL